jgi:kynurenine formamidase
MRVAKMIDLSQELYHNCPVLPIADPPKIDYVLIGPRDGWKLERITMHLHTGTHMDAPAHLDDYRTTLDQIPVDRFQGPALYIDVSHKGPGAPIGAADLEPYADRMDGETVVLLYTGWGEKRDWTKEWIYRSPYLSNEGSRFLVERKVRAVGIDHFSIGGTGDENEETHRILLGAGIVVIEGLQLNFPELAQGEWHVMALPLKIRDSSGAPARVVAFQTAGD